MGTFGFPFMYTGELMDANDLVYLRARYYHPGLGVFASLDPVEGVNRYQYVGGNVANMVDPSGLQGGNCNQGDCGVIMPPVSVIITSNGGIINLTQFEYVETSLAGVQVTPSLSGLGVVSPANYVPGTNMAKVLVRVPTYASLDVIYPSTISPWAIERFFNGQVLAIYDSLGQSVIWSTLSGELLPGAGPIQDTSPQPSGNPGLVSPPLLYPMSYADPILQAIAQDQCLETPEPSAKRCDPAKALAWMLGRGKVEPRSGVSYDYQRYYAGLQYNVPTGIGDQEVEADGARATDCALIETKYVSKPDDSPYILGSRFRLQQSWVTDLTNPGSIDSQQDDEFRRYGDALRAPESVNPFVKLDVVTNNFASAPYFQFWINRNNVPNATVRYGPWP